MKILCWKLKFECLTAETKANNCVMDSFQMPFVTTNTILPRFQDNKNKYKK